MGIIHLCEGVLGYSTLELYPFFRKDEIISYGYVPSWAGQDSGVGIGRGYDFGAQGDDEETKFKTLYIFEHLLKMEKNLLNLLNESDWYSTTGSGAAGVAKKYREDKNFKISTEQAFALFHASWSNAKRSAVKKFPNIFYSIYPPLIEILNSLAHSSSDADSYQHFLNRISEEETFANGNDAIIQCEKMVDMLLEESINGDNGDTIIKRHVSRLVYADMLKRTLQKGIKIKWVPLADTYLRTFEPKFKVFKKEIDNEQLAVLELQDDFPWKNWSNGYEISLQNFNRMFQDKRNKTIHFASAISVYKDEILESGQSIAAKKNALEKVNYNYLTKKPFSNILNLLKVLQVKRKLNSLFEGKESPISLKTGATTMSNGTPQLARWKMHQEKDGLNLRTDYVDNYTAQRMFGELKNFYKLENTWGSNIDVVVESKLEKTLNYASYIKSDNWNKEITREDFRYLENLIKNNNLIGKINGSVGGIYASEDKNKKYIEFHQDNYIVDVIVVKILLSRHINENSKSSFWRFSSKDIFSVGGEEASDIIEILGIADANFVKTIKEFQEQKGLSKTGYITPDSIELKKLNGE